jgi:hypothetical protein
MQPGCLLLMPCCVLALCMLRLAMCSSSAHPTPLPPLSTPTLVLQTRASRLPMTRPPRHASCALPVHTAPMAPPWSVRLGKLLPWEGGRCVACEVLEQELPCGVLPCSHNSPAVVVGCCLLQANRTVPTHALQPCWHLLRRRRCKVHPLPGWRGKSPFPGVLPRIQCCRLGGS